MIPQLNEFYRSGGAFNDAPKPCTAKPISHDSRLVRAQIPNSRYQKIELEFPISGRWISCWIDRQTMTRDDYVWWVKIGREWMKETYQAWENRQKEDEIKLAALRAEVRAAREKSEERIAELKKQCERIEKERPELDKSVEQAIRDAETAKKNAETAKKNAEATRKRLLETEVNLKKAKASYENTKRIVEECKSNSTANIKGNFEKVMRHTNLVNAKISSANKYNIGKSSIPELAALQERNKFIRNIHNMPFWSQIMLFIWGFFDCICRSRRKKITPPNTCITTPGGTYRPN